MTGRASEVGWHFLTGDAASIAAPGRGHRVPLHVQPRDQALCPRRGRGDRRRPTGTSLATFYGIDFPPKELESELERAKAGRIGSPIGRLLLLCYDYDAATGKYTLSILRLIRVLGTATAVALAGFMFVMFRREGKQRRMKSIGTRANVAAG